MARDPQKLRKAYEYKLGKDLADKLSDAHIASLSNYYNRASNEEQSKIDSELIKGMGDFLNSARDLAKEGFVRDPKLPIQKYQPEDLSEVKAKEDAFQKYQPEDKAKDDFVESVDKKLDEKLSETSDSIMSEIDKLIAEYQKKVDDYKKPKEEEEKVPEGLDSLLKDIRSEVGGDTPKKGGALAVIPKPDNAKEKKLLGDEDINPEILKILGIDDVIDLDYGEYHTLLRESMVKNKDKFSAEQQALFAEERSRVRGKTGSFKVKSKKINAQSFVAKTKPSSYVKKVTPLLPSVTPQETEQPIQPERQGMDKTLALIASKLNSVDKNVQQTTRNLQDKDAAENKQKNQDRLTAENTAAQRKEERIERAAVLGGVVAGVKKTVKPLTDMMGGLFDFFKRLGFAMFIMELLKFLQDPAKYINGITKWINLQIAKLEMKIENFVVDQIIKPTNDMIRGLNTKLKEFVDGINPFIEEFKKLPGMGNIPNLPTPQIPIIEESIIRDKVFLGRLPEVDDDFMKFDKAPPAPELPAPGTTQPGGGTRVQPQETLMGQQPSQSGNGLTPQQPSQSGNGLTPQQKAFAETVSYAEGTSGSAGYNTWFGGRTDLDLSKLTINQVVEEQKKRMREKDPSAQFINGAGQPDASYAVGKYQMTHPETYAKAAGLNPAVDKFTPENQDKLFLYGYIMKQAGVTEAEINAPEMSDQTIDKLAPVFASFPNLFGPDYKGRDIQGTSYYGQGGKSKEQIKEVYKKQREKMPTQTTEPAPPPTSALPITVPLEDVNRRLEKDPDQFLKDLDAGKLTRPNPYAINPPVQKASLTTIGGLTGGDAPGVALAAAGGSQSQVFPFSATNGADLSVLSTKETLRVVGT
jgi:hypothetical protein